MHSTICILLCRTKRCCITQTHQGSRAEQRQRRQQNHLELPMGLAFGVGRSRTSRVRQLMTCIIPTTTSPIYMFPSLSTRTTPTAQKAGHLLLVPHTCVSPIPTYQPTLLYPDTSTSVIQVKKVVRYVGLGFQESPKSPGCREELNLGYMVTSTTARLTEKETVLVEENWYLRLALTRSPHCVSFLMVAVVLGGWRPRSMVALGGCRREWHDSVLDDGMLGVGLGSICLWLPRSAIAYNRQPTRIAISSYRHYPFMS